MILFGQHLRDNVLYPMPHRQYVFSIPIILCRFFKYDRNPFALNKITYNPTSGMVIYKSIHPSIHPSIHLSSHLSCGKTTAPLNLQRRLRNDTHIVPSRIQTAVKADYSFPSARENPVPFYELPQFSFPKNGLPALGYRPGQIFLFSFISYSYKIFNLWHTNCLVNRFKRYRSQSLDCKEMV